MGAAKAGSMFGKYQLTRLLGQGGMGEVYEAHDTSKDRTVALKILPEELSRDEGFRTRFQRESRAAAMLEEPHVIPIHDWGEIDGNLYIDMRLVRGQDLHELLQRGPIEPERAVGIIRQIGAALDAAHAQGLIHRDVKPPNILITAAEDFAYLIDFSIAENRGDTRLTVAGSAIGSFAYMAPERFEDHPTTPAVDTYSLAGVLFEALTGQPPYKVGSMETRMQTELSDAQRAVLRPEARLVEACPGAGKTRAIVARFIETATSKNTAADLLSLTNAAIDEAARRCSNIPQATQAPNFMGTFDSFLRRYIVTLTITRERGRAPRYVDTWSDLPANVFSTDIRFAGVNGQGLALAHFHADVNGRLHYPSNDPAAAPTDDRPYVIELAKAGYSPADLCELAETRVGQLTSSGIYDCEQTRLQAIRVLRDPDARWLRDRLATRFSEVIVDEFQDCSAIEHDILRAIHSLGVRVVAVADPDQAICEFRQAEPNSYVDYREALSSDHVVYLDENWRSSPAICALTSSLRSINDRPIVSRRDPTDSPHAEAIYVAVGKPKFARAEFSRLAEELGIDQAERLILAATRKAAASLSGRTNHVGTPTTKTGKIVRNVATLKYSHSARERLAAVSTIEQILLGLIKFPEHLQRAPRQEQLDAAAISQSALRVMVARLVDASATWTSADAATGSIRATVAQLLAGIDLGHKPAKQQFKSAKPADFKAYTKAGSSTGQQIEVAGTHIHSVKGGERDAVLPHIEDEPIGPRSHILELWASGGTHEALRVLYVGASRARRLLVLAARAEHLNALQEVLESIEAPVTYLVEGK